MTTQEMISVLTAHAAGKPIQVRALGHWSWSDTECPAWNFQGFEYRVKPAPMEVWINIYPDQQHYAYSSKETADRSAGIRIRCALFREVV